MKKFEEVWDFLRNNLQPGTDINKWNPLKGNIDDRIIIERVGENYIKINPPNAMTHQSVPQKDFINVWKEWPDYKTQQVKRQNLTEITRFSTYIISILHWYDQVTSNQIQEEYKHRENMWRELLSVGGRYLETGQNT